MLVLPCAASISSRLARPVGMGHRHGMATDPARSRWLILVLVRLATAAAAVLGIILLARAEDTPSKVLGGALVLVALWSMAVVPQALARRWRSPLP